MSATLASGVALAPRFQSDFTHHRGADAAPLAGLSDDLVAERRATKLRPMVFVLDDEPAVRDSLQCLLESERYAVRTFATPDQFLHVGELPRPACLILDLTMPGMSGLEVLRIIDRMRPRLPTVVLTGYADVTTAVAAMRLGAVHLLEKPCGDTELLGAVSEAFAEALTQVDWQQHADAVQLRRRRLSPRERQLLDQFVQGDNLKQIAERLGTSINTVRNQRSSILKKMEADSVADLVRMVLAERQGGPEIQNPKLEIRI